MTIVLALLQSRCTSIFSTKVDFACIAMNNHFLRNLLTDYPFWWYAMSLVVMCAGILQAAKNYPGGFDWFYTVASALASHKHNPAGSAWFATGLGLSMLLLWPYVSSLKKKLQPLLVNKVHFAINALRISLVCGMLLGLERLLVYSLSDLLYKSHELLALATFLGLYIGILALLFQIMRYQRLYLVAIIVVVLPLLAIGLLQFYLYIDQRELGWVDTSWRDKGIPVWLSFAFWQWFAIAFLWLGLGALDFYANEAKHGDS
jgi:hypothetical protein